ncbi:MAG: glycosyltransferase family 39 protein [Patescibacteria group bacterium]
MGKSTQQVYIVTFVLITVLAVVIRLWGLTIVPRGFFTDEAAIGYNAYLLLKTGKDEWAVQWPVFFQSYGDYRLPVPIYANIPTIALLGPTDVAVRTTTALWGVAGAFFMWLLLKKMYGLWPALFGYFFMSTMPWHIHISRWGSEYIYFPTLFTFSLWLYVLAYKKTWFIYLSVFFFGLTMYTYYPSIYITPLSLLVLFCYYFWKNKKSGLMKILTLALTSFLIFILVLSPMIVAFANGTLLTRWNSVSKSSNEVGNKVQKFAKSYIDHLSPDFLFIKGDIGLEGHNITRHSTPGLGEMFLTTAPLFYGGIVAVLFLGGLNALLTISLLLIYPLGSAITYDVLATRSIFGVIPVTLTVVAAVVFMQRKVLSNVKSKKRVVICVVICAVFLASYMFEFVNFYKTYFYSYPKISGTDMGFQYGYKQAMELFMKKYEKNYDRFRITHRFNSGEGLQHYYNLTIPCPKCGYLENPIKIYEGEKALYAARPDDLKEAAELYKDYHFIKIDEIRQEDAKDPELIVGYFAKNKK